MKTQVTRHFARNGIDECDRSPRWFSSQLRNFLTLGREFKSRCSHTNWDSCQQVVGNDYFVGRQNSIYFTVDEVKGRLNPSCDKNEGKHRRRRKVETSCVTFLLDGPGWCVHKSDVQTKWDDDTHTHTQCQHGSANLELGEGEGRCQTFFFFFFPVQQTTSGIGHNVK